MLFVQALEFVTGCVVPLALLGAVDGLLAAEDDAADRVGLDVLGARLVGTEVIILVGGEIPIGIRGVFFFFFRIF